MPKGLYARSLLIVILPMVCCNRSSPISSWRSIGSSSPSASRRRSCRTSPPSSRSMRPIRTTAIPKSCRRSLADKLNLDIDFLPLQSLPPPLPKPFFSLLDSALSQRDLAADRAAFLDRHGRPLEPRRNPRHARRCRVARRRPTESAYASNSHIFIVWMVGTSLVLLGVAIAFLRNQIDRSCVWRARPKRSAKAATPTSGRTARARCGRPAMPSSK